MFLAWNEIKRNKLRFSLITGVLFLVAFLVFFLSGLATGLQNMNREAVDKWPDATAVVLTEESDTSLFQSNFNEELVENVKGAKIVQLSTVVTSGKDKKNIALFGIDSQDFIMPQVTDGKSFKNNNEVIASDALKNDGFKLGDKLHLSSSDEVLTIVGFTDHARFNAAPVLYANFDTVRKIKFGEAVEQNAQQISALVLQDTNFEQLKNNDQLTVTATEDFIKKMPGYTEQNLTLTFMIYFLFIVSAVIVAIFLYVLTVQKISMFGILKGQGISSWYLSRSVIAQTFIIATIGVGLGLLIAITLGAFIPPVVPISFDIGQLLVYGIVLIFVAILGAIFSVFTIVRIDPLEAIGG